MRSIKRETGVLKLVHPGRYIEVHREPIIASEVMRRNPRHCITRPDVFKFPWIVVKPESLLLPGSVFLVVPNHTIYHLLKAKGQSNINQSSPFSQQNQSHNNNHVHHKFKQDSHLFSSYAEKSSKLHKQHIKGQYYVRMEKEGEEREVKGKFHISNCVSKTLIMSPDHVENVCKYDWEETIELWPKVNSYDDDTEKTIIMEQESLEESSSFEFIPYQAVHYYQNYNIDIGMEMNKKDVKLDQFVPNEQVNMLKSCLRKPNSIRKYLNLKVSFNISI